MTKESILERAINFASPFFTAIIVDPKGLKFEKTSLQRPGQDPEEPTPLPSGRIYIPHQCAVTFRLSGRLQTLGQLVRFDDETELYKPKATISTPDKIELYTEGQTEKIGGTEATATLTGRSHQDMVTPLHLMRKKRIKKYR